MAHIRQVKHQTLLQRKVITRLLTSLLAFAVIPTATAQSSAHNTIISYKQDSHANRTLIFLNNPEYLWSNRSVCDLADDGRNHAGQACGNSLFHLSALHEGRYRVWWEHRNMMPAIVQSAIVLENTGVRAATIELEGTHLETNSKKNGGREWAALFNSTELPQRKTISPGERLILNDASNRRIFPGHYFAGVSDFSILSGSITVNEVIFRKNIARKLKPSIYDTRDHFGVHESLVYKGISSVSSVQLTGAQFTIDDTTPAGPLPVTYQRFTHNPSDQERGVCDASQRPVCSGASLIPAPELSSDTSWVTHIAPDPFDANPKRSRAIVDDLIELTLPASTPACPSVWPMPTGTSAEECVLMSKQYQWYLPDFSRWRLPNWGNWAVHYNHPITVTNTGEHPRSIRVVITADGDSPVAFRGSGVTTQWQQRFLTAASPNKTQASLILAQGEVAPGATETLIGEFVLAGPAAGTLEHRVEIYE